MNRTIWLAMLLVTGGQKLQAAESDLSKLVTADNTFAFKLFKRIAAAHPGENIFISPYSAATVLQMAVNGAKGTTKKEMQQVLETAGLADDELNAASKKADDLLNSRDPDLEARLMLEMSWLPKAWQDEERSHAINTIRARGTNVVLTMANALWYPQGATLQPDFAQTNRKFFSSTIQALDFGNGPLAAAAINQWASDQTHGHITDIAGRMDANTALILANAIYFKAKWKDLFDPKLTRPRWFQTAKGGKKKLPMMAMTRDFSYRQGDGYQVVRLPYQDDDLAMDIFLPDHDLGAAKLLKMMNGQNWSRMRPAGYVGVYGPVFPTAPGQVVLPRFKIKDAFDLTGPLTALGMKTAFDSNAADFSGMFSHPFCLSQVEQDAWVEVNEDGTEAAAMTVARGTYGTPEPPPKPFEMIMDRPFLFVIEDARSRMIVFMGLVNDL